MKARKAYLLWKHTGWYNQLSPSMQRLLIWGDAWTMYLFKHTFIYRAAHPLLLPVYPHHQSTQQMKDGGRRMQLVHWHNTYLSFSKAESYDREISGPTEGYCSTTHLMRVTETVCIHTAISGVREKSEVFSYRLKISPRIDYFHSHSFPRSCWFVTLKIYKNNNNKKILKLIQQAPDFALPPTQPSAQVCEVSPFPPSAAPKTAQAEVVETREQTCSAYGKLWHMPSDFLWIPASKTPVPAKCTVTPPSRHPTLGLQIFSSSLLGH